MKTKNRIIALILAVVMAATMFVGCDSNEGDHSDYRRKRLEWEAGNPYNNK